MKKILINIKKSVNGFGKILTAFALLLVISFVSFSIAQEKEFSDPDSNKSFSFKENGSDWRVYFKDNKITELYRDGSRVPDEEVDQYKDMIYDELNELSSDYKKYSGKVHRFHFDVDMFKDFMKKFKRDFNDEKFWRYKLEFDEEDFEKNMKELEEQLKELEDKKIELYFDSEAFQDNMKELEENLKNIPESPNPPDIDIDIYTTIFDKEKFKDGMERLKESIKLHKFEIDSSEFDMSELKNNIKELQKNLQGVKIDVQDIKGKVKNLNQFLDELKSELIADGYAKSKDDEYELEIDKDKTLINGVAVRSDHHKKYLELYKKHFGKEIDGPLKIIRN